MESITGEPRLAKPAQNTFLSRLKTFSARIDNYYSLGPRLFNTR
jgi:hypothetical protein